MSQGADTKNDTMDSSDSSKGKKRKKEMTEDGPKRKKVSLRLLDDMPNVMYGFGDSVRPSLKSAKMLTEMAELYIKSLTRKAMEIASIRNGRLDWQSFVYAIRKDNRKMARVNFLLKMKEEIDNAKKRRLNDEDT